MTGRELLSPGTPSCYNSSSQLPKSGKSLSLCTLSPRVLTPLNVQSLVGGRSVLMSGLPPPPSSLTALKQLDQRWESGTHVP